MLKINLQLLMRQKRQQNKKKRNARKSPKKVSKKKIHRPCPICGCMQSALPGHLSLKHKRIQPLPRPYVAPSRANKGIR